MTIDEERRSLTEKAIAAVEAGTMAFWKFLSSNDTGETRSHQSGIYIPKPVVPLIFDTPGQRGSNKDALAHIRWQGGELETDSRFIYYGTGTRNEYRITRFNRGFPYLQPAYTGDMLVLVKNPDATYEGFVIEGDTNTDCFLEYFGLSVTDAGQLIYGHGRKEEEDLSAIEKDEIARFVAVHTADFPAAAVISGMAREIYTQVYDHKERIVSDPDRQLADWTDTEFRIFRALENKHLSSRISGGFASVDDFIATANSVLNRRKSRAGKSLELHLAALFDGNNVRYTAQACTETGKKPDFIFPSEADYHNFEFDGRKLTFLGAKTTCKDRWRQILNEADRIPVKHLCTLQQGISSQQMNEMKNAGVVLVVPKQYIKDYPAEKQKDILPLRQFISYVQALQQ